MCILHFAFCILHLHLHVYCVRSTRHSCGGVRRPGALGIRPLYEHRLGERAGDQRVVVTEGGSEVEVHKVFRCGQEWRKEGAPNERTGKELKSRDEKVFSLLYFCVYVSPLSRKCASPSSFPLSCTIRKFVQLNRWPANEISRSGVDWGWVLESVWTQYEQRRRVHGLSRALALLDARLSS